MRARIREQPPLAFVVAMAECCVHQVFRLIFRKYAIDLRASALPCVQQEAQRSRWLPTCRPPALLFVGAKVQQRALAEQLSGSGLNTWLDVLAGCSAAGAQADV